MTRHLGPVNGTPLEHFGTRHLSPQKALRDFCSYAQPLVQAGKTSRMESVTICHIPPLLLLCVDGTESHRSTSRRPVHRPQRAVRPRNRGLTASFGRDSMAVAMNLGRRKSSVLLRIPLTLVPQPQPYPPGRPEKGSGLNRQCASALVSPQPVTCRYGDVCAVCHQSVILCR